MNGYAYPKTVNNADFFLDQGCIIQQRDSFPKTVNTAGFEARVVYIFLIQLVAR